MTEIWKPIDNYNDYMVSNTGKVAKVLKGDSNGRGYRFIKFQDGKRIYIHRLVAQAFIPNFNNCPIINHKDGNKNNNRVENLEWCNYSHNCKEAYKLKLHIPKRKVVIQKDLSGKYINEFKGIREAGKIVGVDYSSIIKCCKGKAKTAGGYKWEYQHVDKEATNENII